MQTKQAAITSLVIGIAVALMVIIPSQKHASSLEDQPELRFDFSSRALPPWPGSGRYITDGRNELEDRRRRDLVDAEARLATAEAEVKQREEALRFARSSGRQSDVLLEEQLLESSRGILQSSRSIRDGLVSSLAELKSEADEEARKVTEWEAKKREVGSQIEAAKRRLSEAKERAADRLTYGLLAGVGVAILMLVLLQKVLVGSR
jgi:hypothetical protein